MSNMFPDKCQRCGGTFEINGSHIHTTSMFNKEEICMPCKEREKKHPLYNDDDFGISSLGAWSNLDTDKNLDWAIIKINGGNNND